MYHLLPFNFIHINEYDALINELGDLLITPEGTAEKLIMHELDENTDIFKSLVANFFISETKLPSLIDIYAERLAEKKRFLDDRTSLHIFVLTLTNVVHTVRQVVLMLQINVYQCLRKQCYKQ